MKLVVFLALIVLMQLGKLVQQNKIFILNSLYKILFMFPNLKVFWIVMNQTKNDL